jgi:hypothetical protein
VKSILLFNIIMKPKMGRPRLSETSAKDVLVGARFGKEEAKIIEGAADKAGQPKSQWIRASLLWAAERVNVRSDKWTADDLDGQTVHFKMLVGPSESRNGNGLFMAIQRGDGSMDVRIYTREKGDSPLAYYHVPISQTGIELIEKNPEGSEFKFSLIDPVLP